MSATVRPKRAMESEPSNPSELSDQVDAVFAGLEQTQVSSESVEKVSVPSVSVKGVSVQSVSVAKVSVASASVASASVASASVESVFVPSFKVASESASDAASTSLSETAISSLPMSSKPARLDPKARARQLQLRLALTARADGRLATAVGSMFDFARMYPDTPEALEALDAIAEIALEHEQAGRTRMALDLYERLGSFGD
jgi:hypothetical protein